jgi:hypothetical protein
VKDILVSLDNKVEALQEVQLSLGLTMRQATLDWQTDHVELKANLCALGERLSIDFAGLEGIKDAGIAGISSLTEENMREIVQTAVQSAVSQIMSVPLDESIRQAILASMKECSVSSNENSDSDTQKQLQAISAMLLQLKDDVEQVSSEISEVRVDLKAVNKILGRFTHLKVTTNVCLYAIDTLPFIGILISARNTSRRLVTHVDTNSVSIDMRGPLFIYYNLIAIIGSS